MALLDLDGLAYFWQGIKAKLADKQDKSTALTVTLQSSNWSNNTYTAAVSGLTADTLVYVSPAPASYADYVAANIRATAQAAGSLTFTCDTAPTTDIIVNVVLSEVTAL